MNLDQLQVFLVVARQLHFSRAADELFMTQSAVSATVARLESHHRIKLFQRIGRRVELTDAGRYLAEEAPRLLAGVDRVKQGLQDFGGLRRGVLSLGASFTVGHHWLPARISRFGALHPEIELRCTLANGEQVLDGTSRGQYDLCFLIGWGSDENPMELDHHLSAAEVGQERLQIVVGRSHPWYGLASLPAGQLIGSAWIVRERGSGAQRLFEALLVQAGIDPAALEARLVFSSAEMVKAVVLAGVGAAALPLSIVRLELEQGLLWSVPLEGGMGGSQPIWMVKHNQRYPSPALRAFEAVVRSEAPPAGAEAEVGLAVEACQA